MLLQLFRCLLMGHDWTSAANEGKKPTQDQLDRGIEGFREFSRMYCSRCGHVHKNDGWQNETDTCWECTGSGWMIGDRPCKICRGTGTLPKGEMVR